MVRCNQNTNRTRTYQIHMVGVLACKARLVLSAYRGTLRSRPDVTVAPAHEAVLKTPVPMVCDSEVLGTTTASVRVEQGLLKIAA